MDFINLQKEIHIRNIVVHSSDLIDAANATNTYIKDLVCIFNELGFDIFDSLGQRNISGFIGEIFKHMLACRVTSFDLNPHSDGRPDILCLDTPKISDFYHDCFKSINGRFVPIKDKFTPFQFGGLEVKCSIGASDKDRKNHFFEVHGHGFSVYEPRVGYLNSINWWAHHASESNLLGLYYDYYEPANNVPQIIAALYAELGESDWNKVSTGKPSNKKTSNTSLNKFGLKKLKQNCMFCCSDKNYMDQLSAMKVVL